MLEINQSTNSTLHLRLLIFLFSCFSNRWVYKFTSRFVFVNLTFVELRYLLFWHLLCKPTSNIGKSWDLFQSVHIKILRCNVPRCYVIINNWSVFLRSISHSSWSNGTIFSWKFFFFSLTFVDKLKRNFALIMACLAYIEMGLYFKNTDTILMKVKNIN